MVSSLGYFLFALLTSSLVYEQTEFFSEVFFVHKVVLQELLGIPLPVFLLFRMRDPLSTCQRKSYWKDMLDVQRKSDHGALSFPSLISIVLSSL